MRSAGSGAPARDLRHAWAAQPRRAKWPGAAHRSGPAAWDGTTSATSSVIASGATLSGLPTGWYTVTVTDDLGCTKTLVSNVAEPPALTLIAVALDENCGQQDGLITLSAGGGAGSFMYDIGNGPTPNNVFINLSAGIYNVSVTDGNSEIVIAKRLGKAIRFHESKVRPMGRTAAGVRGVTLESDEDEVIGMVCASEPNATLLVVSEKGYGKRSDLEEYRITNRGGKGVKAMNVTDKTGVLVAIKEVVDTDDLMIINKSGITIRISMDELRVMGRATQGVRLIKVGEGDEISSVEKISREEEELSESSDIVTDSTEITELPESPESPESPIETTE